MRYGGILIVGCIACLSCSSKSSDGADAGVSNQFTCGGGGLKGTARAVDATNLSALEGATLVAAGCTTAQTDDRGYVEVSAPAGQLYTLDITKSGYIPEHGTVAVLKENYTNTGGLFPESLKATLFTGWTAGQGYVGVIVQGTAGDAGGCTKDGVVVSIEGHPELKAGYATDIQTRSATLTATDAFGAAAVGPVPPGTYKVVGTKTGCTSSGTKDDYIQYTDTITVVADRLTVTSIRMAP